MKIMIVGSGGREHAIGWKLAAEEGGSELIFVPGNGGTPSIGRNILVDPCDLDQVEKIAEKEKPDLIVIGPEDPLALGIVDRLGERWNVFGPSRNAARIETSKAFAREIMARYEIPTPDFSIFTSAQDAHRFIEEVPYPVVVKADGLAKGKGSIVTSDRKQAHQAVDSIMEERIFGQAGDVVVIEERLFGEEASIVAITDSEHYVMLPPSQDHKRLLDGDMGPNTGGMGAYCPCPIVDDSVIDSIEEKIIRRLLIALKKEGIEYRGVIYAGVLINRRGVFVIEFNARFGDPETQCTLPVFDSKIGTIMLEACQGRIQANKRIRNSRWALCVIIASGGYPGKYQTGKLITGLREASSLEGVVVFHAGTKFEEGRYMTNGGRVLGITGIGDSLNQAYERAYAAAGSIKFEGCQMRRDIGQRGLARLKEVS
ncbi:MAG: phosphoribosylamine--glycine ligase [bacterium]